MHSASGAAQRLSESPARVPEIGWRNGHLPAALSRGAFARESRRGNFCSSISICFADERVQFRRRESAVDTLTSEARSLVKIGGDSREMERGSSVYNDEIARYSEVPVSFAVQNCADQFRVYPRAAGSKSIEALPFQSKIAR